MNRGLVMLFYGQMHDIPLLFPLLTARIDLTLAIHICLPHSQCVFFWLVCASKWFLFLRFCGHV